MEQVEILQELPDLKDFVLGSIDDSPSDLCILRFHKADSSMTNMVNVYVMLLGGRFSEGNFVADPFLAEVEAITLTHEALSCRLTNGCLTFKSTAILCCSFLRRMNGP
jgi:hypothetical protein